MKFKIKLVTLISLSIIYPYIFIDLVLDEVAPWNPLFIGSSLFQNNWISLIVLISLFSGILYLGKSVHEEKKDKENFILMVIYKNVISLSILVFMLVFSILMILLVSETSLWYFSILYILFFPVLGTFFHYFYTIKLKKIEYSFNFNISFLFFGVVLPVIIYGLLAAAII